MVVHFIRQHVCKLIKFTVLLLAIIPLWVHAGFSVSGTQLLDANGQSFVIRGINHAHTWFTSQTNTAIPAIAKTGANTVRVVLSNGQTWTRTSPSEVQSIINLCKQNKLVCVLEVHDATGSGESENKGTIAGAAAYWVDIASVLKGQEDFVIINIANEPTGNNTGASAWASQHQAAIRAIRNAGLTHTLMVDAGNWGQDWQEIMLAEATNVAGADDLKNTLFSVHMYEVYQTFDKVNSYITGFASRHNLPLVVGEFGANHQSNFVDADSIMEIAEQRGVGYMGWSWSGNGDCCIELDIVNNWNANSLSVWGERLINGANGIKQTSKLATIYTGDVSSSSSAASSAGGTMSSSSSSLSTCGIALNDIPYCTANAIDPEQDGWGWENEASCVVPNSSVDPTPGSCVVLPQVSSASNGSVSSSSQVSMQSSSAAMSSSSAAAVSSVPASSSQSSASSQQNILGGSLAYWWLIALASLIPMIRKRNLII